MSDIYIEHTHDLDFETARTKAKQWLNEASQEYGFNVDYQEGDDMDTARVQKSGVNAQATLTADQIVFKADLAFLAKPLKGVITNGINVGLQKHFG